MTPSRVSRTGSHVTCPEDPDGYRKTTRSRESQDHILDMSGPQTVFWRTIWEVE